MKERGKTTKTRDSSTKPHRATCTRALSRFLMHCGLYVFSHQIDMWGWQRARWMASQARLQKALQFRLDLLHHVP